MADPREPTAHNVSDPSAEIDDESATVLPNREALSVIDPSFVTRVLPVDQAADPSTGQGIDESGPAGSA